MRAGITRRSSNSQPRQRNLSPLYLGIISGIILVILIINGLLEIQRARNGFYLFLEREGIVLTQRDGSTGIKGIFAGGDLTSNQRTVAHAIGSGKRAALAIDCYLSDKDSEEAIHQILIGEGPSISISRYLRPERDLSTQKL
jgi:hypothetical protein